MRQARLTIRARLTLVYSGVFVLGGVALLAITYALAFSRQVGPVRQEFHRRPGTAAPAARSGPAHARRPK